MERWGWTAFNLAEVKDSWPTGNRKGFIEVLTCFRGAKATDLRDKVYSLLSLASETYQNTLVPNYSVSNGVADVYIQLANCAADSSHYDRVLAWASTKANVSTHTFGSPPIYTNVQAHNDDRKTFSDSRYPDF